VGTYFNPHIIRIEIFEQELILLATLQIHNKECPGNWRTRKVGIYLAFFLLVLCTPVYADDPDTQAEESGGWKISGWNIQTSLYTKHWDSDPDHTNKQKLIGPELVFENDYLVGLAIFRNSFDQPSQFLYIGKTWRLFRSEYFYFKLVGGLLHGYKEPYEDKIPLNGLGVAPAILPSFGIRYKRVMVEVQIAGTAAITITGGLRF
jgi:hypothetical protein